MQLDYNFIIKLKSILFSSGDEWKIHIDSEFSRTTNALAKLAHKKSECLKKLEGLQTLDRSSATSKQVNKTQDYIKSLSSQIDGLESRVAELADNTRYAWNAEPFKNVENLKFLLANIHILEERSLEPYFNKSAVTAIKNMLTTNFSKIYDTSVGEWESKIIIEDMVDIKFDTLPKILAKEPLTMDDLNTYEFCKAGQERVAATVEILLPSINMELFSEATKSFLFVAKSYFAGDKLLFGLLIPMSLSLCFSNIEDIDNFLANKVDYSTLTSIENSFIPIQTIPSSIACISQYQKDTWSKLNAKYGKESMAIFMKQEAIANKIGIPLEDLFRKYDGNLDELFAELKISSKNTAYENITPSTANFAEIASKYNITEEIFHRICNEVLPRVKEYDDLPDIRFTIEHDKQTLYFQKLQPGDLRGLFLGHMTGCCQSIGGDAEASVISAFTRQDAGFYVLTDAQGKVKAQSLAWIGHNKKGEQVVVLDSFEHNKDVAKTYIPIMQEMYKQITSSHPRFTELHIGQGGQTPYTKITKHADDINEYQGMHRYGDSRQTYLITEDVALATKSKNPIATYNSAGEYLENHRADSFNALYKIDPELTISLYATAFPGIIMGAKAMRIALDPVLHPFLNEHLNRKFNDRMEPTKTTIFYETSSKWIYFGHRENTNDRHGEILTLYHKLKLLKHFIEQSLGLQGITSAMNSYCSVDPRILEYVGYENVTALPPLCNAKDRAIMAGLLPKIVHLKDMRSENRLAIFCDIFKQFQAENNPEHWGVNPSSYENRDAQVKKILHDHVTFQNIFCNISLEKHAEFINALLSFTKEGSNIWDSIIFALRYKDEIILNNIDISELASFWNGKRLELPPYLESLNGRFLNEFSQIESRKILDYVKSMDATAVYSLERNLKSLGVKVIKSIGIDDALPLCDTKNAGWYDHISISNLAQLKTELEVGDMSEELRIDGQEEFHKIHIAKRIILLNSSSSIKVDFPILGWYKNLPDGLYCNQEIDATDGHEYYVIGHYKYGESVTLEHI